MDDTLPGVLTGEFVQSSMTLPEIGESIGRYVVLERLGAGGMGVVFAAYDPELDRKVAVKLLHSSDAGSGSGEGHRRSRLLEEARALAKLSHPNIIAVHDAGVFRGEVFVAMEYVDGQTLAQWQRDTEPAVAAILDVYRKAAEGLAAAHRAGIVHRDFKPDNVMLDRDGRVRVLDFGLARSTGTEIEFLPEGLVGTPAYMAPEQFAGGSGDAKTDQFSFTVALYEALFGERPFVGNTIAELAMSTLEGKKRNPPPTADIPDHVLDVFGRGLALDPTERFGSMDTLLDALAGPEPRRRRGWLRSVAASLAGAGMVASLWFATDRGAPECESLDFAPAAWTAQERTNLQSAAEANLSAASGPAIELTLEALDRYASEIERERLSACLLDAERPDPSTRAKLHCLDRREAHMKTTVELFADNPGLMTEHGPDMVASLAKPARCWNATGVVGLNGVGGQAETTKPSQAPAVVPRGRLRR